MANLIPGISNYEITHTAFCQAPNASALYEAGHIILTRPVKGCSALKSWAIRLAKRAGMKKAKVALARKLAVIMHRMLVAGKQFNSASAAA